MTCHRPHQLVAAASLCATALAAHATSSISDYLMARSGDVTADRSYWYGDTVNTQGAGQFAIVDSHYSAASLTTAFGAMSGAAGAIPPVPAPASNVVAIQANAEAEGLFQDSFHVGSATLADGTPVTLLLTVTLDGSVARSAVNGPQPYEPLVYAGWGPGPDYALVSLTTLASGHQAASFEWSATVGASFDLVGVLHLRTDGLESLQSQQSTQTQVGSGSAHYYLDVLTPGVTVSTGSGWNYALAVPEPSPAMLLMAGAAVIGVISRRRAVAWR